MRCVSIVFAILAFGVGIWAAVLWFRASTVRVVPLWEELGTIEPVDREQAQSHWTSGLIKAGTESSRLNRSAAFWTAWAVVFGAIANVAGGWPIWPCW
jgi:hypothetical protein